MKWVSSLKCLLSNSEKKKKKGLRDAPALLPLISFGGILRFEFQGM